MHILLLEKRNIGNNGDYRHIPLKLPNVKILMSQKTNTLGQHFRGSGPLNLLIQFGCTAMSYNNCV